MDAFDSCTKMKIEKKIPIPIFVISYNRVNVLKETLNSFESILDPYVIVICDNNSTYPPLIRYLKNIETSGIKVMWNVQNDLYGNIDANVKSWFNQTKSKSPYYVVTDPDVKLCNKPMNLLKDFSKILEEESVDVVGPMLRIDDIPDYYPLKSKVMSRHRCFWEKEKSDFFIKGNMKLIHAPIDTTFGLYRRNYVKNGITKGIRVCSPYIAQHLDWYIDPNNMKDDQIYYIVNSRSDISHWNGGKDFQMKIKKMKIYKEILNSKSHLLSKNYGSNKELSLRSEKKIEASSTKLASKKKKSNNSRGSFR